MAGLALRAGNTEQTPHKLVHRPMCFLLPQCPQASSFPFCPLPQVPCQALSPPPFTPIPWGPRHSQDGPLLASVMQAGQPCASCHKQLYLVLTA